MPGRTQDMEADDRAVVERGVDLRLGWTRAPYSDRPLHHGRVLCLDGAEPRNDVGRGVELTRGHLLAHEAHPGYVACGHGGSFLPGRPERYLPGGSAAITGVLERRGRILL
jgi:hypothetical protein